MTTAATQQAAAFLGQPNPTAAEEEPSTKAQFLQLLTAQLRNQSPLNPMKGHEFVAQLAQFTSVEELINIKNALAGQSAQVAVLSQSLNSGVAAGLIGNYVEAAGNGVQLAEEGSTEISFDLGAPAQQVTITIRNEAGEVVDEVKPGLLDKGMQRITWDGIGTDGERLPAANYTFEVTAVDAEGGDVAATPYLSGRVERVTFTPEGIMLWVAGTEVPMGRVRSVSSEPFS